MHCYSNLYFSTSTSYFLCQAIRQEYADFTEDKQMQAVDFERAEVVLDLSFPDPKTVDGWKIQLLTWPKV